MIKLVICVGLLFLAGVAKAATFSNDYYNINTYSYSGYDFPMNNLSPEDQEFLGTHITFSSDGPYGAQLFNNDRTDIDGTYLHGVFLTLGEKLTVSFSGNASGETPTGRLIGLDLQFFYSYYSPQSPFAWTASALQDNGAVLGIGQWGYDNPRHGWKGGYHEVGLDFVGDFTLELLFYGPTTSAVPLPDWIIVNNFVVEGREPETVPQIGCGTVCASTGGISSVPLPASVSFLAPAVLAMAGISAMSRRRRRKS